MDETIILMRLREIGFHPSDVEIRDDKFTFEHNNDLQEVSFALLLKLSKTFGTEKIDVRPESRQGGYCETCSYEYGVSVITVIEPTQGVE